MYVMYAIGYKRNCGETDNRVIHPLKTSCEKNEKRMGKAIEKMSGRSI